MSNRLDLRLNKGMSTSNYDIEFNQGDTFFDSIFIYFSTWLAFSAAMTGARSGDEMSGRLRGVIIPQLTFRNTQVLSNLINSNSVTDLRFTVNMVRPQQPSGRRVGTMKLFEFLGQQTLGHSFEMAKSAIETKYGTDRKNNWPSELQFFYHIRNGCFHGNRFNIQNNSISSVIPTIWRGKNIDYSDNNRKVVGVFLFPGDIVHLLYDIQQIL